jgi:pimeloyl-ACP methyl ester carboxylesterase
MLDFEPMVGRYATVEIGGRQCRLFIEEAGSGVPLVCLHTAGADARQYRHLLADSEILDEFRVIAFDLPWHGKSLPPQGWHDDEYQLTTEFYDEAVMAVVRGLELDQPIIMGCSMGGRIVLHLARVHGDELGAVIGLSGADHQQPWYDTSWLNRPDIHGGEVCAAIVSGLIAPQSPEEYRWETLWHYMQSGPGVFKGDLFFYREDSDFRGKVASIDTGQCPVFLLTGEYDFSCTVEDSDRTANAIAGAQFKKMTRLGHFPMSENPQHFRKYLLPVLRDARKSRHAGQASLKTTSAV